MPEYTDLQIAILTMPKEDLNTAAGIITDWTGRLLDGRFEDDDPGEDRQYDMPEDLRPHLEVLGGMKDRVERLVDAIDNFGGYFPTDGEVKDGEVKDGDFLVEFYESEAFENAPTLSASVDADSSDAIADSAQAINEWAVRMVRVKDDLPAEIVASLQSLLGLNFWVRGLIDALDDALSGDRELFDVASR